MLIRSSRRRRTLWLCLIAPVFSGVAWAQTTTAASGPSWEQLALAAGAIVVSALTWIGQKQIARVARLESFREQVLTQHLDKEGVRDEIQIALRLALSEQLPGLIAALKTELRAEMDSGFARHDRQIKERQ